MSETCKHGNGFACVDCAAEEQSSLMRSLSGFGAEILIAQWEVRARQCDYTAEQFRTVMSTILSSHLEKARAYRSCIEELRRQMGHESKRQPTERT